MDKEVKRIQLTVLVDRLCTYPEGEYFQFYFKPPRFHQLLESCLHYHFEEGHPVSQKTGKCCFASDLLNSLGSSVTAAAYSHRKARETC